MSTAPTTLQSKANDPVSEMPEHLIHMCLSHLGWVAVLSNCDEVRWIDPNQPENTPTTTTYAWYVSKMRVKNRSDTKYHSFTNGDLADLVGMKERKK
ncbi:hypothetical protein ACQKQC_18795 [Vibrio fortis]|uniref:hypothetical protein n=1 Tax=Vibrio fortis TaxID=212667 RepID=UPI0040693D90